MLKFYLDKIKINLLSDLEKVKELFLILIKHVELKELKQLPDFNFIKNIAMNNLTAEKIFSSVAIVLVRQDKNLSSIRFLVEECNFDLKTKSDENGCTLLHEACLYGSIEIAKYFLKIGANPDVQNNDGITPLHQVVQFSKNLPLIAELKKYKANMNIKDEYGMAPIHIAALRQNMPAISALKSAKANMNLKFGQQTWQELSRNIKNGSIKVNDVPPLQVGKDMAEEMRAKFYKILLQLKFNEKELEKLIEYLLKKNGLMSKDEAIQLANCYVLKSFSPEAEVNGLNQFIELLINSKQLTLLNRSLMIVHTALTLLNGVTGHDY
ncbi:MAG: ankyrin repeat domain-containing protein [Tatlockia sp.]|nr:ankyrin repeat domain-containing protein [Tatlockia sp.]